MSSHHNRSAAESIAITKRYYTEAVAISFQWQHNSSLPTTIARDGRRQTMFVDALFVAWPRAWQTFDVTTTQQTINNGTPIRTIEATTAGDHSTQKRTDHSTDPSTTARAGSSSTPVPFQDPRSSPSYNPITEASSGVIEHRSSDRGSQL